MTASALNPVPATGVECSADEGKVILSDGQRLAVPIVWFPRLKASAAERDDSENGEGIHRLRLDGAFAVAGLLAGKPSVEFGRGA